MSNHSKKYSNKVAVVTGSSRGIGKAIALHLIEHGANVIGFSRKEGTIQHPQYTHYAVDIRNAESVRDAFLKVSKNHEKIDFLINNAAVLTSRYSMIMPASNAQDMVDINILGTFYTSRECAKIMQKSKFGRIVNIGSMAVSLEPIGDSIYAATKAAISTLSSVMSKEFAASNITCNTVAVTAIATDMLAQLPKDKIDEVISRLPIPRYAKEDDIFNVIDFFISDRSSYVTSQTVFLGGLTH